ncbi:MAG: AMP-binding protein [Hyphomicrobiales bacterium]|nr:AMP-binding protein [Hyphomicrobiales bacterium]
MTEYFDLLETRSPAVREAQLLEQLRRQVRHAQAHAPHYQRTLAGVDADALTDRAALARLPVPTKSELIDLQAAEPPFGGLATVAVGEMAHLFLSPGPIAETQGAAKVDPWRMARALFAAGFRRGDRALNCFSYHATPAGFIFDAALQALSCAVFPGGVGATETQVEAIRRFGLTGYVGTPDFLKIIMEKAAPTPLPSMVRALVTAGPLFPSLRSWYADHGVFVRQCYATAELGLIAFETADPAEGMVIDEGCIVEIVRPGTGNVVPDGEVGEVVVTTFDSIYPLIRFATGDLSAIVPGRTSSCGRTNALLRGWLGRADQTTKVRGMFVHPRQVARVVAPFPDVVRARLEVSEVDGSDTLQLLCECSSADSALAAKLADAVRRECGLRGEVSLVAPGSLPNDGKVIEDKRRLGA